MAPRTLVSRIDRIVICASPKASCRSIADFAWEVGQSKPVRSPIQAELLVFRNPLRRLASAYLNKYVEHSKYRQASLQRCPEARLDCFADFIDELDRHGFRCIDKTHFRPQIRRYRWRRFDRLFNSEDLEPLQQFINRLFETNVAMPFRVRADHPGVVRDRSADPAAPAAGNCLSHTPAAELRALLAEGRPPGYRQLFDDDLLQKARRIYAQDLHYLERCRRRGILSPELHAQLSAF
ncbi:MAG: sulfotransferase family 2 domain-containing protein [Synechococcaceae cyanobacterium]|nr:sulfotransferase family 2 domain-containing protein [Synechococcaceae cyanobacterium]